MHLIEYGCSRPDSYPDEIVYGYWAVVSFEARLKWCSAIVNFRTEGDVYADVNSEWNALNNVLIKKAAKRAEIAHGSVVDLYGHPPAFYPYFHKKIAIHNVQRGIDGDSPDFRAKWPSLSFNDLQQRESGFLDLEKRVARFGALWRERDIETGHPARAY